MESVHDNNEETMEEVLEKTAEEADFSTQNLSPSQMESFERSYEVTAPQSPRELEISVEKVQESESRISQPHNLIELSIKSRVEKLLKSNVLEEINLKYKLDQLASSEKEITRLQEKEKEISEFSRTCAVQVIEAKDERAQMKAAIEQIKPILKILDENAEKLNKDLEDIKIDELQTKVHGQKRKFENLSASKKAENAMIREKFSKKEAAALEMKNQLEAKLQLFKEKKANLKKCGDMAKLSQSLKDVIENQKETSAALEEKLREVYNRKNSIRELKKIGREKLADEIDKCRKDLETKTRKLEQLNLAKDQALKEKQQKIELVDLLHNEITEKEALLLEREQYMNSIKGKIEETRVARKREKVELQSKLHQLENQLQKQQGDLQDVEDDILKKFEHVQLLKQEVIKKLQEKSDALGQAIQQNDKKREEEMLYLKKKFEVASKKEQIESLEKRLEALKNECESLDTAISNEENTFANQVELEESKYQESLLEQQKYLDELRKKKEYQHATADYLKKKQSNLQEEMDKIVQRAKVLDEENLSVHNLKTTKTKDLDDLKMQLWTMKNDTEKPQKRPVSCLKSPQKNEPVSKNVKFNDTLYYRSATEESDSLTKVT